MQVNSTARGNWTGKKRNFLMARVNIKAYIKNLKLILSLTIFMEMQSLKTAIALCINSWNSTIILNIFAWLMLTKEMLC